MKKTIFLLSAAALMIAASCTKIETETPDQAIKFNAANYTAQTRAGEKSLITDEGIDAFKSKAYMVGEGVTGVQDFFGTSGEIISWNATDKTWTPEHVYFWPKSKNSYVNFFSWYDTGNGPAVTNGTMKWEDRVIATGDNIMYADPAWRFQQNTNAATYGLDGVKEGVPTLFHHALSQVEFRVYATELIRTNVVEWTIKLTDIELKVNNQGTLSLTATEPTSGYNIKGTWDGTPAWTATGTKGSIMPASFNVTATAADAAAAKLLANQSVLPQDLTGVNLVFKLDITTHYISGGQSNQEVIAYSIPLAAAVADGGFNTAKWDLNTKYIYTIKISPSTNEVLFDPAVETAWTVVDAGEKEL